MKPIFQLIFIISLVLLVSSCKKFLDVRPDNTTNINPRTIHDFEEILNNSGLATPNYMLADFAGDDVWLSDKVMNSGNTAVAYYMNTYAWASKVWRPSDDDEMYNGTYQLILPMNVILDNIEKATGDTAGQKAIVKAQACINRAYYYLQLANIYGPDYQPASAGQDLAVPLVLHPDATQQPRRNTVKEVYDQILTDLQLAINTPSLPDFGVDVIHPGKAAAYAMLARTYLLMSDYEKALETADGALKIRSMLLNYAADKKPFTLKDQEKNPEVLLARVYIDHSYFRRFSETIYASIALSDLLGTSDMRFVVNFDEPDEGNHVAYKEYSDGNISSMQFNYSLTVAEMMLIKAECLARKGDEVSSVALLNRLRQSRFNEADYTPLTVSPGKDALTLVLEERRRELFFHGGLRLFDLKRLNRDPRFKLDLTRVSAKDSVIATLPALSPKYLMPFTPKTIANNPSIIQNER
ncbi:RagB/SusD family nutrient uptake outer membrane protein [Chitinophaga polysaccharea]|uniref:RagB/SusD family nutrient uptake outer membrane protein n=1 Tax=Chitinophaga polysaccharea TaxID=1293035 RepID=UPI00163C756E|nr:RagB/SusD family nutrient uptake outer membrane protein [Chitinophaga polysaccharea]